MNRKGPTGLSDCAIRIAHMQYCVSVVFNKEEFPCVDLTSPCFNCRAYVARSPCPPKQHRHHHQSPTTNQPQHNHQPETTCPSQLTHPFTILQPYNSTTPTSQCSVPPPFTHPQPHTDGHPPNHPTSRIHPSTHPPPPTPVTGLQPSLTTPPSPSTSPSPPSSSMRCISASSRFHRLASISVVAQLVPRGLSHAG